MKNILCSESGKNFSHKVNKFNIPTCNILGVNIAAINMNWLLEFIHGNIEALYGEYICVSNVHTVVMSNEEIEYCAIQNGAIMALPDGGPLSYIGQKYGFKNMLRITGPSFMEEIFKVSLERGYKHYFYGSTEDTLEKLIKKIKKTYPGLEISSAYSPPFRPLTEYEDNRIVEIINELSPDFIWIGLGAPKQEMWMAAHQGKVNGLMVGVGAGFDYFAGNISRAPVWMQQHNLEWLYRLIQDPKRLFKRYFKYNSKFIYLIIKEKIKKGVWN